MKTAKRMMRWRVVACLLVLLPGAGLAVLARNVPREPMFFEVVSLRTLEAQTRSPVVAGMQVAIKSLWCKGGTLSLEYTFRWVGPERSFCFLRLWGLLAFHFWDAEGNKVGSNQYDDYILPWDFGICFGKTDLFSSRATVDVPAKAKYVAIELDRSGIVTKRVAIPE